jgi:hypothetical protein
MTPLKGSLTISIVVDAGGGPNVLLIRALSEGINDLAKSTTDLSLG